MLRELEPYATGLGPYGLAGVLLLSTLVLLLAPSYGSRLPLVNGKKRFEFQSTNAKRRFVQNAQNLIQAGLAKASAFRIITENGEKTVLSPKYAPELRSHHALNFGLSVAEEFHSTLPGFEPFAEGTSVESILQDAIRTKLTQSLDWHEVNLKGTILRIVAQLSSKVFLGDRICRDPAWLRITVTYTVNSFLAAQDLRMWPKPLRRFANWFLPSCRKIREQLKEAKDIITPVIEERRAAKEAALKEGREPERYVDAMQWMEESAKGRPYNPTLAQISFSVAAIHTTSDLLTQVLFDIAGKDDLVNEMRDEVIKVIQEEGWKKATLYKLRLMDSVLKETQRVKPIAIASMRRLVQEKVTLSDGTVLPKGSHILVSTNSMWDESVYPNAETYDPYRFLRLREVPGHETSAQCVSPSPDHMAFGYGKHACPGRFFAINEVKIALCHILLKYEFKLAEGCKVMPMKNGISLNSDPRAKVAFRRRKEELVI
ncbi:cytochrome P450 [Aspergillus campestris IBT 28561]|uniref:Cytochrome P450 n=1 Tax=Aspergillus campestris (strain IBT 28561) TaxID=1392248 RepID=A0A2I1CU42_ASPC2|nr:cytochrome P450 [Aspergillus campestris IBT 28561]PKY01127.1 cytochrome P450 [Aspergillus campestris IBT 28561]